MTNSLYCQTDHFDISIIRGISTGIARVDMNLIINSVTYNPLRFGEDGSVIIPTLIDSTSTSTGALIVSDGVGIGGNLNVGGTITSLGDLTVINSVAAGPTSILT